MGFIVFLVFLYVIVNLVRQAMRNAGQRPRELQLPPDFFGTHDLPPEHVLRLPSAAPGEESSSEVMWDETASDHELDLSHAEVVSLEPVGAAPVVRALPAPAASLEVEVDWEAEHQRFHQRYVDAPPAAAAPANGLLAELHDPGAARRAVLMAEILGPPISMRGPR